MFSLKSMTKLEALTVCINIRLVPRLLDSFRPCLTLPIDLCSNYKLTRRREREGLEKERLGFKGLPNKRNI
jgi:hypothetical protein